MNALVDAALAYSARGWYVFPCEGKRPVTPNGYKDATIDPEKILKWWASKPDANIGLALRQSGLIAIDVDPRNGGDEQLAEIEAAFGNLPRDCHQKSPHGEHFVMQWGEVPVRGKVTKGKPLSGLDIKWNGYILVEPSRLEDGKTYEWERTGNPPVVPDAWQPLMRKAPAPQSAGVHDYGRSLGFCTPDTAKFALEELGRLPPRGKNTHAVTRRAWTILFHDLGLSLDEGWPLFELWNRQNGDPHPQGQLKRQLHRIAERVAGGEIEVEGGRGWWHVLSAAVDRLRARHRAAESEWDAAVEQARNDIAAALNGSTQGSIPPPLFEPAVALLRRDYPPTPWLVDGLITEGGLAVIATEPKSAKTWAATELAIAVSSGTDAFGAFGVKSSKRVAYFYAEDLAPSVQSRLRSLAAGRGAEPETATKNLYVQPRGRFLDLTSLDDLALIVASCRRFGELGLLVLDPLRDIHSGNEDKSDDMAPVMGHLRVVGDLLQCTVLFVHHTAKVSGGRRSGLSMRGSSAIHGSVDCGIYLSDLDGDGVSIFTNRVHSEIKGARSSGQFSLTLEIADGPTGTAERATWTKEDCPNDPVKERRREAILQSIREAGRPLSKNQIRQRDGKTKVKGSIADVNKAIDGLAAEGVLKTDGKKFGVA